MPSKDEKQATPLPEVKVGETWEDYSVPSDSEAGRRLRVVALVEPDGDEDAKVRVQNLSSWMESEIRHDRFLPEPGGFRRLA